MHSSTGPCCETASASHKHTVDGKRHLAARGLKMAREAHVDGAFLTGGSIASEALESAAPSVADRHGLVVSGRHHYHLRLQPLHQIQCSHPASTRRTAPSHRNKGIEKEHSLLEECCGQRHLAIGISTKYRAASLLVKLGSLTRVQKHSVFHIVSMNFQH